MNRSSSIVSINYTYGTIMTSIWSSTILVNSVSLLTIVSSRTKLTRSEFYILSTFNLIAIVLKLVLTLFYIHRYFLAEFLGPCSYLVFQAMSSTLNTSLYMTLFYYSLYQTSNLSRNKWLLKLFNIVHNWKNTFLFEVAVFLLASSGAIAYSIVVYKRSNYNKCANLKVELFYLVLFWVVVPSILPVVLYAAATVYICYCRFSRPSSYLSSQSESKRFRRNVKLLMRFLALALIVSLSLLPQTVYYFISILCPKCTVDSVFLANISYVGYFFYGIVPFILIYIHKILRRTFLNFILTVFNFVFL